VIQAAPSETRETP